MAKSDWRVAFPKRWDARTRTWAATKRIDTRSLEAVRTAEIEKGLVGTLTGLYNDAAQDLYRKAADYLSRFEEKDNAMRAKLNAGEVTQEYYNAWRLNGIGRGERVETMARQMAQNMVNVNQRAAAYINDTTPEIYALNHDYMLYTIDRLNGAKDVSFTLTSERAVREAIAGANHVEFRLNSVDPVRDYLWNRKQIERRLTMGLLEGKSMKGIAADFLSVMQNNEYAAIRNARTAVTSAQAAGCQAAMEQAVEMGVRGLQKEWIATDDGRTRESHAELDGVRVEVDEAFPNGLMYPCDPTGDPSEVYNCRCTMRSILPGMDDYEPDGSAREGRAFDAWRARQEVEE